MRYWPVSLYQIMNVSPSMNLLDFDTSGLSMKLDETSISGTISDSGSFRSADLRLRPLPRADVPSRHIKTRCASGAGSKGELVWSIAAVSHASHWFCAWNQGGLAKPTTKPVIRRAPR